jgi:hypothetical protein
MIKFFRRIRQKLVAESKFSKYLIYAAGEIVLVVIGILIALQINNANENRKLRNAEIKILKELVVNLRTDSIDHSGNLEWYVKSANASRLVVEALESKSPWNDTMAVHYGWIFLKGLSNLNTSAYDNLKAQGFGLISNDSIRLGLTNLYSDHYDRYLKYEQEFAVTNYNQVVSPVLLSRLKMDRWFHATPLNYEALLEDEEFREVVRWKGINMAFVGGHCRHARDGASELIAEIEREIQRLEN